MINLILIIFAFVLLLIEAFRPSPARWPIPHLGWLGLALLALTFVLQSAGVK